MVAGLFALLQEVSTMGNVNGLSSSLVEKVSIQLTEDWMTMIEVHCSHSHSLHLPSLKKHSVYIIKMFKKFVHNSF
jgi:hypothetical protein